MADLLSHPVLIGYMAGIAVLMIVSQRSQRTAPGQSGLVRGELLGEQARKLEAIQNATANVGEYINGHACVEGPNSW